MKVIFDIPTLGDACTMAGGIVLRYRAETGEFIVHDYAIEADGSRSHFRGYYATAGSQKNRFMNALCEFNQRAEKAGSYDTGGAIDFDKLLG